MVMVRMTMMYANLHPVEKLYRRRKDVKPSPSLFTEDYSADGKVVSAVEGMRGPLLSTVDSGG
jgi:hypothetical protein